MKHSLFLFLLVLSLSSGCKKFLTTEPASFLAPQEYYKGSNFTNALAGVYNPLFQNAMYGGNMLNLLGICSDEGFYGGTGRVLTTGPAVYNLTYADATVNGLWSTLYIGIESANQLISNININDSSAAIQAAYGEALFLRAYYHFLLVSNFGAVPLKLTPTNSPDSLNIAKTPIDKVYAQIVKDMTLAEGKVYTVDKLGYSSRVSKTTVEGILARVCLFMAGYPLQDQSQYANALFWANKVQTSGLHSLNPSFSQVFINEASDVYDIKECMWEADFSGNNLTNFQAGRNGGLNGIPFTSVATYSNVTGSSDYIYSDSGYSYGFVWATQNLYSLYDVTDARRDWGIQCFNYTVNTTKTPPVITRTPITGTFAYNRTCAKWRRTYETVYPKNKGFTPEKFPLLRYSDVLLMLSEAELNVNGSTSVALAAINAVRERGYGLTSSSAPIKSLTLLTPGSGYTSAPVVGSANLGSGVAYSSALSSGKITSLTLTAGGLGFTTTPTIYIGNAWTPNTSYSANTQVVNNGLLYTVTTAGFSTTTPPTQSSGPSTAAITGAVFTYAGVAAIATGTLLTKADVDLVIVTMQNIQDERARELCFEALRVPDLIRWGIFIPTMKAMGNAITAWSTFSTTTTKAQVSMGYNNVSNINLLLPIPSSEMSVNKYITQNPGY